jgi:hypothetical protein
MTLKAMRSFCAVGPTANHDWPARLLASILPTLIAALALLFVNGNLVQYRRVAD